MQLQNKIALVTGASSGIGKATAGRLARDGADIVVVGRNEQALREVAASVEQTGRKSFPVAADITKVEDCRRAVDSAIQHFGRLDVLVNSAGVIGSGTILDTTLEDWRLMMQVNLDAVFVMMQLAAPHLEKTKGAIVNVSSITGLRAFPNVLSYCVSKAGVDQLTRCAALDLAPKGVRVNAVNPGVVVTNLHRRGGFDATQYDKFLEHGKDTHPLGRVGEADEIAEAILYLATSKSEWVTGVTLSVDGGRHLTCAR